MLEDVHHQWWTREPRALPRAMDTGILGHWDSGRLHPAL